jgi:L-malate glycosyltransferase
MRILYVADALSVHTRRWAEAFRDRGAEVHVATFRQATIEGVTVHTLSTHGLGKAGYLLAIPRLRWLAAALRPDVVHAQYITSYGFIAATARLHPLIVTAWGSDVLVSPHQSRWARWLGRTALARCDHATTVADHMTPAAVALGAPPHRITAIAFGVDTALFRPPVRRRADAPPLRMISTRNFAPVYNVECVVDAVRRVCDRGADVLLDLVGDGALRPSLQSRVTASGLAARVTFHGHIDHPRLASLLGSAHVFVSSALSDGNNVSLNEAMACGAFPIATDIPANRSWIEQGRNGLLYEPGDAAALSAAIERIAGDAPWRERAAVENRAIVEKRADWRSNVDRMAALYSRVMAKSPA